MAERETVIDYTIPYYEMVGITILMHLPSTPSSLFRFLTVLETNVWLCILAAYFFTGSISISCQIFNSNYFTFTTEFLTLNICSFLMWIFDRYSPCSHRINSKKFFDIELKRAFNLKECLWFCMTSLTPQGGGERPKSKNCSI